MTLVKYALLALLVAGAGSQLLAGLRAAKLNMQRLRSWKRLPATVDSANNPTTVDVRIGTGRDETILKIPITYDLDYTPGSQVTVIENPENSQERRLTRIRDLWNPTIVALIFASTLTVAAWLVWSTSWGANAVWREGRWRPAPDLTELVRPDFEVREPRQSWIANLVLGCLLGLPFVLPAFLMRGEWRPWPAVCAAGGLSLLLWTAQSVALNYSRTVRLSGNGLEERSLFGRRLVPTEELGGLEFRDVAQDLETLKPWQMRNLTHFKVWAVKDKQGREAFTLPEGMTPDSAFRGMREKIGRFPARRAG